MHILRSRASPSALHAKAALARVISRAEHSTPVAHTPAACSGLRPAVAWALPPHAQPTSCLVLCLAPCLSAVHREALHLLHLRRQELQMLVLEAGLHRIDRRRGER